MNSWVPQILAVSSIKVDGSGGLEGWRDSYQCWDLPGILKQKRGYFPSHPHPLTSQSSTVASNKSSPAPQPCPAPPPPQVKGKREVTQ